MQRLLSLVDNHKVAVCMQPAEIRRGEPLPTWPIILIYDVFLSSVLLLVILLFKMTLEHSAMLRVPLRARKQVNLTENTCVLEDRHKFQQCWP